MTVTSVTLTSLFLYDFGSGAMLLHVWKLKQPSRVLSRFTSDSVTHNSAHPFRLTFLGFQCETGGMFCPPAKQLRASWIKAHPWCSNADRRPSDNPLTANR